MTAEFLVAGVHRRSWFRTEREKRQVVTLSCLDIDPESSGKRLFYYDASQEERDTYDFSQLEGRIICLIIQDVITTNGGRITFVGRISRKSIPIAAICRGKILSDSSESLPLTSGLEAMI